MYYYYCSKCGNEKETNNLPPLTRLNIRDGVNCVHHQKCSKCNNYGAGFMLEKTGKANEKILFRSILKQYQTED